MANTTYTPAIFGVTLMPNPVPVGSAVKISVSAQDIANVPMAAASPSGAFPSGIAYSGGGEAAGTAGTGSLTKVRAKFNGAWSNLTYNNTTGRYEGTVTPMSATTYYIDVEATNASGVTTTLAGASYPALKLVVEDTVPPALIVSAPADGLVTAAGTVPVSGTATDSSGLQSVTVNGTTVSVAANGTFSTTVNLSAGVNTITIIATDTAGNSTTVTRTVTRATAGPVLSITSPADGALIDTETVQVTGTVSDSVSAVSGVDVNGVVATVTGGSYTATVPLVEGANTLTVVAQNQAGLTTTLTRNVTRDTLPPELEVTSPAADLITNQAELTVSGTVNDANLTGVTVDGEAVTVTGGAFSTVLTLAEGTNTVTVSAYDAAGHVTTIQRSVLLDTREPVLALISPPEGWISTNNPTVIFEATDQADGSGVDLTSAVATVDGTPAPMTVDGSLIKLTPLLADGYHVITVTVHDRAGNTQGLSVSYGVDTVPPVLELEPLNSHRVVDTAYIQVAGTATDEGSGVARVTAGGTTLSVEDGHFSGPVPLEVGINQIVVTTEDYAGNTDSQSFMVIRLVTDRTQADTARMLDLCRRGYDNWTLAEREWWANTRCFRGTYDDLDINRVNTAVEYIHGWIEEKGYLTHGYEPDDHGPWTESDAMTRPQGEAYLKNVDVLRGALYVLEILAPETPATPLIMRNLTVLAANDIEKILVAVDALRPVLEGAFAWPSGVIYSGGGF